MARQRVFTMAGYAEPFKTSVVFADGRETAIV